MTAAVRRLAAALTLSIPSTLSTCSAFSSSLPSTLRRRPLSPVARCCALSRCRPIALAMSGRAASTTTPSPSHPQLPLSSRVRQTIDPCVILMKQLIAQHSSKWQNDPVGILSLAQGVVHWKPPPGVYDAIRDAATLPDEGREAGGCHLYCPDEGLPELVDALRVKLREENGLVGCGESDVEIGPHIIVTAGANQAYVNCAMTFLDETDKAVIFEPYYFNHHMAIQMTRGEDGLVIGPTKRGVPDLDWLRSQLSESATTADGKIRLVTLVNPGNPTGVSLTRCYLEKMVELTRQHNVWLVVDNTYEHFDHARKNDDGSGMPFPCFENDHVVNIFSFSKGYGMAGLRVGYVVLNGGEKGREAYEQMLKVQDTIPICASKLSQIAALSALTTTDRSWVGDQVQTLDSGRGAILTALQPLKDVIGGDGAMYVMGRLPDGVNDQEFASTLVERYGVAIIPGSFCGYPGWIRVCYSNLPPEQCAVAAERLTAGIADLCGQL